MLPMRKLRCRLLSLPYPSLSLLRRGGHAPQYPPCVRARCGVCTRGQASRILVFVRAFLCLSACAWARPGALLANGRRRRPALRGLLAMPRAAKAPARLGRHVVSVAICHKGELPPVLGTEAPESVQVCDRTVEEGEKGGRDRKVLFAYFGCVFKVICHVCCVLATPPAAGMRTL